MTLDLLIQPTLPKERKDFKPVSPTLLVGIGGTGKEILLRFRRLVVERYGDLAALPFVQFVHLDTDKTRAAQEQYDLKSEDDPLFSKIRFQPAERVSLTIEGGTGKYVTHIDRFPNIKRWFETRGKIAGMGNLGEGAGQFRSASRLGFFHRPNFESLSSRLDRVGGRLRDAANQQKASSLGFQLDPSRIEIAVVASLAGGTGGGCFLDTGYLLAKVFPGADRIGIFLLPNFFRGYAGATRARANGYAALTELNYYSFGHFFQGDWDPANRALLPPPPYSNTYLIDATNEAGLEIGSGGKEYDIYSMVSEFLYQDFSIGSFSGMKRATRVNLEQFNLNVYTHNFLGTKLETRDAKEKSLVGDTYPTRFGSFGLSTISFPTDRVHNACACRLAQRILTSWETTLQEDPLERLFTSFLIDPEISFVQGRYEKNDGTGVIEEMQIEDALLWFDRDSGKTFPNHIWDRAQSIRSEIAAAPKGQKSSTLAQHRSQVDQLMAKEDSSNPEDWGQWIRTLEDNMRNCIQEVKEGLLKRTEEIDNDPHLGVAVSLSLLREFKSILRNETYFYLTYFDDNVETWQEETTRYSTDFDRLQTDVDKHDRQLLFRKADLERDIELLVAEDADAEDLGVIYNYLYSRVMKQVSKRGKKICEDIDEFLGKDDPTGKGLIARYYQLLGGFHHLGQNLRRKEEYFSREQTSELHFSLFRRGDVDEWYRTWVGESEQERQVQKRVGNELLSRIFGVSSVTQALEYIQETKAEEVEDQVFAHCKSFFSRQEEQPQALKMLLDGNRGDSEEKIRLAYNLGKVWTARARLGLEHTDLPPVKDDQRPCLIGLDTNDRARAQKLEQLIDRIDDTPRSFLNIGENNRGTIVFYNELAGVPAFYGNSITAAKGLKESYRNYKDKAELHTDRNRFQFGELIPKTDDEAKKYAHSLRAFVLARLLGLLRIQEKQESGAEHPTFFYSYRKEDHLQMEEIDLGDEPNAVDVLYRDTRPENQTDRAHLLLMVEQVIDTLKLKGLLSVYALLIDFYKRMVYPPVKDEEWIESLIIYQYSPEYAVLEDAYSRMQRQLLPSMRDKEKLKVALDHLKGRKSGELDYEEYLKALEPYCQRAGKFSVASEGSIGIERVNYYDALVLDLSQIDQRRFEDYKETEVSRPKPQPRSQPQSKSEIPLRPCPNCSKEIDTRAAFCKHCKKTVAAHVTCPHCGEENVPDDLKYCWKCDRAMPEERDGEKIDCPNCFSFNGYESDFPCPICNYNLTGGNASQETEEAPNEAQETEPVDTAEAPPATEPEVEEPEVRMISCPNCFEQVEAGPLCPVCGNELEDT